MKLNLTRPLAIFDLEATGPNIASDKIVEIFVLKVMPDGTEHEYHSLVNPRMPMPANVIAIHGITDEDVKDAPSFLKIAFELKDFLEGCDLGGYNSNRYDVPLLLEEFYRIGINLDLSETKFVDVFKIFVKQEGRDLASAYKFYCDKELKDAHSAKYDVHATYEVLKSQLDRYEGELQNDINFLHDYTYENQFLDSGRRLILEDNVAKFNFGKHKGKTVEEVLRVEPQYYDWIMRSDFLHDTKQKLTLVRNEILDKKKKPAVKPEDTENNTQNNNPSPKQTNLFD